MRISEYQHQQIARRAGNREKELDLLARDLEMLLRRLCKAWRADHMGQVCNLFYKAEDFLARKGRASPLKKKP